MIKVLSIIGARPQIIKAAAFSRAVQMAYKDKIKECILHTGQHYDQNMSTVFFDQMGIPKPDFNLKVGSGNHGKQTALMIKGIEDVLLKEKPNCMVVYGDTNSTLAGAIAAAKLHVPIVHIEAGLRSFNKAMPEEVNRIMCDHVSTLLFTPTEAGYYNLIREGFKEGNAKPYSADNPKIYHCGDVMYDNSKYFSELTEEASSVCEDWEIDKGNYVLATIHRNNNTDEPKRLNALFSALNKISVENNVQVVLPIHPRTSKLLKKNLKSSLYAEIKKNANFKLLPAVSFLDMVALEKEAKLVMTDSGGVQKEAYFFNKPCVILRSETEWVELVDNGNAIVADADENRILEAYNVLVNKTDYSYPPLFGDGKAALFICEEIVKNIA